MQKTQKNELLNIEVICSEITISNKKRPPDCSNLLAFFKELGKYSTEACENYDNFIVI